MDKKKDRIAGFVKYSKSAIANTNDMHSQRLKPANSVHCKIKNALFFVFREYIVFNIHNKGYFV